VRRIAWLLLAFVTAIGVLLLFVFPGRTLLSQDHQVTVAQQHIAALQHENSILHQRQLSLEDPAQIEQYARERFGLVLPGQQLFAIPGSTPAAPKATVKAKSGHSWWQDLEPWH
jgi:cell division protein FtsB